MGMALGGRASKEKEFIFQKTFHFQAKNCPERGPSESLEEQQREKADQQGMQQIEGDYGTDLLREEGMDVQLLGKSQQNQM